MTTLHKRRRVGNPNKLPMQLLSLSVPIKEPGYVYIYISNEGSVQQDIYFDDLTITHEKSRVVQADDYYPFGLMFNSYQRENSVENRYLYNGGSELQQDLNLGFYSTLFRTYDPAIGRFMQIDPLADFMPGINPYSFAFDNPVLYGDPFGLKPTIWQRVKAFFGIGRLKGSKVAGNQEYVNVGNARKGKKSDSASPTGTSPTPQMPIQPQVNPIVNFNITTPEFPEIDLNIEEPTFPDPDPVYKGRSIPASRSISFSENITFQANSDKLYDSPQNGKIINDLVKTLKDYPQLQLFIVGNAGTDLPRQVEHYGNSKEALGQGGKVNGVYMTFGDIMTARARALYQALISAGIDPGRLNYGPGVLHRTPKGRKTSFVLKN